MFIKKKIFTFFIVFFIFLTSSYGQDRIVYLDLDNVVNNTSAGRSILDKLEKSKKSSLLKFEEKEKKFDPENVYKGQPNPTKI